MTIIIWKCGICKSIQVSNSKQRHQMDSCECGSISLDLEEYGCRLVGSFKDYVKLKEIKPSQFDIWHELILCTCKQGFAENWSLGNRYFIPLEQIVELNKIEKEGYLSFILST